MVVLVVCVMEDVVYMQMEVVEKIWDKKSKKTG